MMAHVVHVLVCVCLYACACVRGRKKVETQRQFFLPDVS